MGLTVALIATLSLAASASTPQDAAGWRVQAETLYAQGDFRGALEAAERARTLAPTDPWIRYEWLRALTAVDPEAARRAVTGIDSGETLKGFPDEEHARFETALGYLCLDLGIEPLAALHFGRVPPGSASHPQAQAGLAILSVRRGNARLALEHFDQARAVVRVDPSLAELERDARYDVVLHEFATARDLRDANAAGRAYSVLDELRPSHPSTLQARADLAALRGDMPARERALRDLIAVDPKAPGAAGQLADTLLALNRPYDAYDVARRLAPERLAGDPGLQAIEREWIPHFEASLDGRWRSGRTDHDRLDLPAVRIAWSGSDARWGRLRLLAETTYPESDRVPAGEPFGSSTALPALSESQSDKGIGGLVQWAPRNGLRIDLGTTPSSFAVSNLVGGLRFRFEPAPGSLFLVF
jgi:tetratricopeptide (TPR) repeat protein